MEKPLVSVIIPVYNGENFLLEAIECALSQTYENIEIIVVNDGSSDRSEEIALSYGNRIRYYRKENGGVSTALNLAIGEMRGEYFSWLSHDDLYDKEKIEVEVEASLSNGGKAVYCNTAFLDMPDRKVVQRDYIRNCGFEKLSANGFCAVSLGMISGIDLLIPKRYFDNYGGFDTTLIAVQDYKKWYEMFSENSLVYIDRIMAYTRRHSSQVTNNYSRRIDEENYLHMQIIQEASVKKLNGAGISLYDYYQYAFVHYGRIGAIKVHDYALEKLLEYDDPDDMKQRQEKFIDLMKNVTGERPIYLYCAGRQGKAFIEELLLRGVEPVAISDSSCEKWGKDINGIKCISPAEIPKEAALIVTMDTGEALADSLREDGFENVHTNEEIEGFIMQTPVAKEKLNALYHNLKDYRSDE